jgi:hypothetical protein
MIKFLLEPISGLGLQVPPTRFIHPEDDNYNDGWIPKAGYTHSNTGRQKSQMLDYLLQTDDVTDVFSRVVGTPASCLGISW